MVAMGVSVSMGVVVSMGAEDDIESSVDSVVEPLPLEQAVRPSVATLMRANAAKVVRLVVRMVFLLRETVPVRGSVVLVVQRGFVLCGPFRGR
jgi:hypothetical protein